MNDWHPEDIKAAVRKRGGTMAEIARATGVSKQTLSACLQGRVSEKADCAIADFLGRKPHEIWPSRYRGTTRIRFKAASSFQEAAA